MSTKSISSRFGQIKSTRVFGVEYQHLQLLNGDDLYFTEYGLPFIENLLPENFWTDSSGQLVKNNNGIPEIRICTFELLRRTEQSR